MAICASNFRTLASGTRAGKETEREELGAVLLLGIDLTGEVSVEAACVAVRACATVSAKLSPSGDNSERGPLHGANALASSLMRPISIVPSGVLSLSMCQMGLPVDLHKEYIMHEKG